MNVKKFYSSDGLYKVNVHSTETLTADRTIKLPDAAGTLMVTAEAGQRYVAVLTQAGTAAPTATEHVNQLSSTITWARSSQGVYTGTLTAAFSTDGKTDVWMRDMTNVVSVVVTDANTITITMGNDGQLTARRIEINVIP